MKKQIRLGCSSQFSPSVTLGKLLNGGIVAPGVPVLLVLAYTALGVLAFVGTVIAYLTLMQFILRHGGT